MKWLALAFFLLLAALPASATTYYVDNSATGCSGSGCSDSNNGTTKTTAWLHAPGMASCTATCGSTAIHAGDQIILRGGDIWGPSDFNFVPKQGTSANPVYYGVDQTWFTNASWTRPIFDAQNSSSIPNSKIVGATGTINNWTLDNLEIRNLVCPNANFGCGLVSFESAGGVTIKNCYIHGWGINGTNDSNHGAAVIVYDGGSVVLDTLTLSNSEYYLPAGNNGEGVYVTGSTGSPGVELKNSVLHDMPGGFLGVANAHNNTFYNISQPTSLNVCHTGGNSSNVGNCSFAYNNITGQHTNLAWIGVNGSGASYFYDNLIYNSAALAPIYAVACWGNTNGAMFIYNNVYAGENIALNVGLGLIDLDSSQGSDPCGFVYIYNNTLESTLSGGLITITTRPSRINTLVIQNNHFINPIGTVNSAICSNGTCFNVVTLTVGANNVAMSNTTASNQGYTASNNYAPASANGGTVGAGATSPSPCTGCTGQGADINGITRTVPWDAGAYEFVNASNPYADLYIAQNSAGTADGLSCANAKAVSFFNTAGNWGAGGNQIAPGTMVHACGTFTGTAGGSMFIFQGGGGIGKPVTLKFEPNAVMQAPYWGATSGAIECVNQNYITIDGGTNGSIQNTANGSGPSGLGNSQASDGVYLKGCSNVEVKNLTIKNIFINTGGDQSSATDSTGVNTHCIEWDDDASYFNVSVHDNSVSDCKIGIRMSFEAAGVSNISVYNNTVRDTGWSINFGTGATPSTLSGAYVYNNDLSNWTLWQFPTSAYHTDGIIIYAVCATGPTCLANNGYVYNNYIHGDLGCGSPTSFIYLINNTQGFDVFNNRLVDTATCSQWGKIWLGASNLGGHQVLNNTVVGASSTLGGCIWIEVGAGNILENNICTNSKRGVTVLTASFPAVIGTSDYNEFWNGNGAAPEFDINQNTVQTYSQYASAGPFETHGIAADPQLDAATQKPSPASPAIKLGVNLSGLCTAGIINNLCADKNGSPRSSMARWDAGALNSSIGTLLSGGASLANGAKIQ